MPDTPFRYYRARSPEPEVAADEPVWFLYEIDEAADAVTRSVEIYPDGRVTRNSIDLEQRNGDACPSLIDTSLREGFADAPLEAITARAFEDLYGRGTDQPFWFPH